jgi:hypothetical protein
MILVSSFLISPANRRSDIAKEGPAHKASMMEVVGMVVATEQRGLDRADIVGGDRRGPRRHSVCENCDSRQRLSVRPVTA